MIAGQGFVEPLGRGLVLRMKGASRGKISARSGWSQKFRKEVVDPKTESMKLVFNYFIYFK